MILFGGVKNENGLSKLGTEKMVTGFWCGAVSALILFVLFGATGLILLGSYQSKHEMHTVEKNSHISYN